MDTQSHFDHAAEVITDTKARAGSTRGVRAVKQPRQGRINAPGIAHIVGSILVGDSRVLRPRMTPVDPPWEGIKRVSQRRGSGVTVIR